MVGLLNRPSGRGIPAGRRQPKGGPPGERIEGLDRALPVARRAHHQRPVVILQRSRDDLGGAGARPVHQHHDGQVRKDGPGACMEGLALPGGPPPGLHDGGTLVEEELRYGNSLVQESAGIPPHVENESLHSLCQE